MGDVLKFPRKARPAPSYGIVEMWTFIQQDDSFDSSGRTPRITILRDGIEYKLPADPSDVK